PRARPHHPCGWRRRRLARRRGQRSSCSRRGRGAGEPDSGSPRRGRRDHGGNRAAQPQAAPLDLARRATPPARGHRTVAGGSAPLAVRARALPSLRPLAETATRRGLLPDPLRFRGVREHRPGDARKEIHWKASARLQALQTKLYEPATSLDAIFLVNVASYEQYWIQADPEAVELVVSAAADLVRHAAGE